MTLAVSPCLDTIRGCADAARACVEWAITSQVTIRTRRWTNGALEDGDAVDSDLVLPKRFPIRQPNGKEVASSGGRLNEYSIVVSGISPVYTSHGGGGFTVNQLDPSLTLPKPNKDTEILYMVDGDSAGIYTLVTLDSSDPTAWILYLANTRLSP